MRRRAAWWLLGGCAGLLALVAMCSSAPADADPFGPPIPGPGLPGLPTPGNPIASGPSIGGNVAAGAAGGGIGISAPQLAPAVASIFLCAGRGAAVAVGPFGGGYCDYAFEQVALPGGIVGTMHVHCEWGSASLVLQIFNCWRVFPGQPDHPATNDPDIIPDGWTTPWALTGPTPSDQWPPPGLMPIPPPPPPPPPEPAPLEPTGPPPGPPPQP